MPLYGVTFDEFPGLDLLNAANETSGAIDLLNVEFDQPGRVRARDGYVKVSSTTDTNGYFRVPIPYVQNSTAFSSTPTVKVLAVENNAGAPLKAITETGTVSAIGNLAATGSPTMVSYARFGSPTLEDVYIAVQTDTPARFLKKLDGTTLSTPPGLPLYVATTPWDNRLVQANFANAADSPANSVGSVSTVYFSDAGAPDTYTAAQNAYVRLNPGDGEQITGVVAWREYLFVFKQTRCFVFTGVATHSDGTPEFVYRTVPLPGVVPAGVSQIACGGRDAVYVMTTSGVYASAGGNFELVSLPVSPIWTGLLPPWFADYAGLSFSAPGGDGMGMTWFNDRLYCGYVSAGPGTALRQLVLDTRTDTWTLFNMPTAQFCTAPPTVANPLGALYFLTGRPGNGDLFKVNPAQPTTTDAGVAITSRYRSPFMGFDYRARTLKRGYQGVEKTIRESILDGTGTVVYALTKQWVQPGAIPAGTSLTMGTAPAVGQNRDRTAVRGRMFSFNLSAAAGAWTVEKIVLNLRGISEPGLERV